MLIGCGELARHLPPSTAWIDELRFWLHPAVSGAGRATVRGRRTGSDTNSWDVTTFGTFVTLLRYQPA